jgi:hypothetical protein
MVLLSCKNTIIIITLKKNKTVLQNLLTFSINQSIKMIQYLN